MSAYIVTAVRSAVGKVGKNGGALSNVHSVDLGGQILDQLVINTPSLDPADVDDVIFGCVTQIGENAGNLARQCILSSTQLPITVPGTTVDRQCGSSQQAVHFAAQAVMSGTQDIVIAGGVESMGRVPMFSNFAKGKFGNPNNSKIQEKFGTDQSFFSQFVGAEMMGVKFCISRSDMDSFAAYSHEKATIAQANGVFKDEIVPIDVGDGTFHTIDEGVRPGTTAEKLSTLKTLVEAGMAQPVEGGDANGSITAGNASQMSDGGSAILVVNDAGLKKLGGSVTPLAMIRNLSLAASDPILMLSAPIPATQKLLKTAGLTINDIDRYEVNEAFAVVPLAWQKELGADPKKLNVNGGACALGHPLGATGGKLLTSLVHELKRSEKQYGLLAICEGGGTANATLIERC